MRKYISLPVNNFNINITKEADAGDTRIDSIHQNVDFTRLIGKTLVEHGFPNGQTYLFHTLIYGEDTCWYYAILDYEYDGIRRCIEVPVHQIYDNYLVRI